MKILLDHCLDWRLGRSLQSHQVKSAQEVGWDNLKNGKLLAAVATVFEVLLTVDRNLKSEQNLKTLPVAVIVLIGRSNRLRDLLPLLPHLENALAIVKKGQVVEVDATGFRIVSRTTVP